MVVTEKIEKLQLITHGKSGNEILSQVNEVCDAGVKWVQLRAKNISEKELLPMAEEVKGICDQSGVKLIINDHPELAKSINAHGVHLGKNDMSPAKARRILGSEMIIGGTANTHQDIHGLIESGVDYIGYGPFGPTKTKNNLSPVLGIEGYKKAVNYCNENGFDVPLIAIGGINENDVESILSIGIHGIAISSAIVARKNIEKAAKHFLKMTTETSHFNSYHTRV